MLLPLHKLNKIDYYECSPTEQYTDDNYNRAFHDVIIIYYKGIFSKKNKFVFRCWINSEKNTVGTTDDYDELKKQLDDHFKNQPSEDKLFG